MFISTTVKYVNKTVEALKASSPDSLKEDLSILEELLLHRMAPNDVITMVIDLLMAGVDTVSHHIKSDFSDVNYLTFTYYAELQHHCVFSLLFGEKSRQTRKIETRNFIDCRTKGKSYKF